MTAERVRQQVYADRVRAHYTRTGRRRVYRIRVEDWTEFLARYHRRTEGVDW